MRKLTREDVWILFIALVLAMILPGWVVILLPLTIPLLIWLLLLQ